MSDSASEFWDDIGSGTLLPQVLFGRMAQAAGRFRPDEVAELEAEYDDILGDLYPGTTYADTREGHPAARVGQIGYWAGRYLLVDEAGYRSVLTVSSAGLAYARAGVVIEKFSFADGLLTVEDDKHVLAVRFALPAVDGDAATAASRRAQPSCHGTLQVDGKTLAISGRRGCLTVDGIGHDADGDPPTTWEGTYAFHDGTTAELLDLELTFDPRGHAHEVHFAGATGSKVLFINNCLAFRVGDDPDHRVSGGFVLDEDDRKRFVGIEVKDGVERRLAGTLTKRLLGTRPKRLLRAGGLTATTTCVLACSETPAAATAENPADTRVVQSIAKGTERTLYQIELQLTGLKGLTKDSPVALALVDDLAANDAPFQPVKDLLAVDGAVATSETTAKVTLRSTQGETHSAAVYNFRIDVGTQSARVRFEIYSLESLVINQVDCPDPVRGKSYTLMLSASGGREPYTWTPITTGLPPGLTFSSDPATGFATISGTVGTGNSQETFSVIAEVSCDGNADGVVGIAKARQTLTFHVVEDEQVQNQLGYATWAFGALAGIFLLFDFFYKFKNTPTDKMATSAEAFFKKYDHDSLKTALDRLTNAADTLAKEKTVTLDLETRVENLKRDLAGSVLYVEKLQDIIEQMRKQGDVDKKALADAHRQLDRAVSQLDKFAEKAGHAVVDHDVHQIDHERTKKSTIKK